MKRITAWSIVVMTAMSAAGQSLKMCQEAAARNYPLIKRYDLIRLAAEASADNIDKERLPQIVAFAQATVQNKVVELPGAMTNLMTAQGIDFKGLAKEQYKIGIDLSQTIYDGGLIKHRKAVTTRQAEADAAQNDVSLYAVRQSVNNLYFDLLLIDSKIRLNQDLQTLLAANEKKLTDMVKMGTAAEADLCAMQAEHMAAMQVGVELKSEEEAFRKMLSLLVGQEVTTVSKPSEVDVATMTDDNHRLELQALDAQSRVLDAQETVVDARLRPTLSAFAQGYYGYPGYNMYKDMASRTPSLNGLIGLRMSWNIGSLYTHRNDKMRLAVQRRQIENSRKLFLFNTKLETTRQNENIRKYAKLKEQDLQIILLRQQVRRAAEAKLAHGTIDVSDLIREINDENRAKLQLAIHDTEMMKEIYSLKHTINH